MRMQCLNTLLVELEDLQVKFSTMQDDMSSCSRRMEIVTSTVIKLIESNIKESGAGALRQ